MNTLIASRVPPILLLYWIIKIAATTLGETGADHFSMTLGMGYGITILVFFAVFGILLAAKLAQRRYEPVLYWSTFTASAIAGTAFSDYIDRTLGLGYALGSVLLVILLIGVLVLWYRQEGSLSVERITTARAETFYWLAFLVANTLGTAAGDYLADDAGFGFLQGSLLIGGILVAIAAVHRFTRISPIVLFWLAFVLTRPFGATFGDLLTKPVSAGGLDLGTLGASVFFAAVLAVSLVFEVRRHRRESNTPLAPSAPAAV